MDISAQSKELIRSVPQKISALIHKTSGTKKRYDSMLIALAQTKTHAFHGQFTHDNFADFFSRKLKPFEGIVMSHATYENCFGRKPNEMDIADLQHKFSKRQLSLAPLYKKLSEKDPPIAVFMVVHRQQNLAIELADELRSIITGKPINENPHSQFIRAAIKISEELGQSGSDGKIITKEDIYDALQLLSGNEVYMLSMSYCMMHSVDPKLLDATLQAKGFKVLVLKKDEPATETMEAYKFYDNLLGLAVAREDQGIELAKENMDVLFRVCEAAEAGLPRAAVETTGANYVQ